MTAHSHSGVSDRYSISFRLFCIAAIFVYLNFIRGAFDEQGMLFPESVRAILAVLGPSFLFLAIWAALYEGQLNRIKPFYRAWLLFLLFYYVFLLLIGVFAYQNDIRQVVFDFILLPFFFAGILMGCKKANWIFFDKFILVYFTVNVLVCLFFIGGFAGYLLETRHMVITAFNQIPYFFWGTLGIWPYFILSMADKSMLRKMVTIVGTMVYFSFAIIFLKRAPFVILILFLLLFLFSRRNIIVWVKVAILLLVGVIAFWQVLMFNTGGEVKIITEALKTRFVQQDGMVDTLSSSNRLSYDLGLIVTQFSGLEFIVGRGLGGAVEDIEDNYPEKMTHSLHNGSALTMLKGGVVLLIVWVGGWLFVFKDFIVNRNRSLNRYYIPVLMPFLLSWVFGFLSGSVSFLLLMMCAGHVMSKDRFITPT